MSEKQEIIIHGQNCKKEPHTFETGHLHSEDDDSHYDVDGVVYCGRCHVFIDWQDTLT